MFVKIFQVSADEEMGKYSKLLNSKTFFKIVLARNAYVCAGAEGLGKLSFATCTSPITCIMHHVYPPKFYITFVFHFSCVLQSSQEKLKTMFMQNFWVGGQTRCARIVGDLQMTNKCFTGEDGRSIEPTLPRSELV